MGVILGSARIDESGNARGGQAGDQNGREVSTQAWYRHDKGWRVFRARDAGKAARIAQAMQAACDNPHIGYDQGQRLTLYNAARDVGFDPAFVVQDCETDCSALVRVCLAFAGITAGNFRTSDEAAALMETGEFVEMIGPQYTDRPDYLRVGDVLVTCTKGHTVVVLSDGDGAVAADTAAAEMAEAAVVEVAGIQSRPGVRTVKQWQALLLTWNPGCLPKYGADGKYGEETDRAACAMVDELYRMRRGMGYGK